MPQKPTIIIAKRVKPTLLVSKRAVATPQLPFPNPANPLKVRGLAGTPQSRALLS